MELHIRNLKKEYHKKVVVDIADMHIKSGEILGLTGPNGSGKTTFMRILAGLENADDGDIKYDLSALNKETFKRMTYVSPNPYLMDTTVFNNIAYPLKIRKYNNTEIQRRVNLVLDEFGIQELKEKSAKELSSGEGQRVALARALVFEPDLILLDEPTANIDKETVPVIERVLLKHNKESGMTIIIATHDVNQPLRLCKKIIKFESGILASTIVNGALNDECLIFNE